MSEILRVDQVQVAQWGRASTFTLDLSGQDFVVLHGPNESGKTSLATALAWLIAGPGNQGTLQRFGTEGETLQASLKGRLGASPLSLRVRAKVTRQSPGSVARETLAATVGGTSFIRRGDLPARLRADFDGYRRLYWVEALEIANGSDLGDDVSVQAVFGGINPSTEADSLGNRAQELLGALKGSARTGSARQLLTETEALDREIRKLSDARDNWARIETELRAAGAERDGLEAELRKREAELKSVQLALKALDDGVAAERVRASSVLADTPEPSDADHRLHEQLTLARTRIGELQAAEKEATSAQSSYRSASNSVDGDWRQLITAVALGEPGIDAAYEAEHRVRSRRDELKTAVAARQAAYAGWAERKIEADELQYQWDQQYREGPSPAKVLEALQTRPGRTDPLGRTGRAAGGGQPGQALSFIGSLVGTGCATAATVLSALRGDWAIAVAAAGAAAAAAVVCFRALRTLFSADKPPDPGQEGLAEQIHAARSSRDDARERLERADEEQARQQSLVEDAQQDYRRKLAAVETPDALVGQFEPDVVPHLRSVRSAQLSHAHWSSAIQQAESRLEEVRAVLAGKAGDPDDPEAAATQDSVEQADARAQDAEADAPRGERPDVHGAAAVSGISDAAGAKAWLDAACDRVDRHRDAVDEARAATDALKRAVDHDEIALAHLEHDSPVGLQARKSELEQQCNNLKASLNEAKQKITNLMVSKRSLESQENNGARLALERSALTADIESLVVRGLGHHLAASLLRDAAERHRKTQQPRLLRRTQEMVRRVADWHGVTINPRAPAPQKAADPTDSLLVDGPRGEHTAQRLSLGARTLLYLALRLATVEDEVDTRGVRLPLILDDVLVGLDDQRAGGCLEVLAEFSERHQMVLLTCHESTMQRAKAAGAAVLPIPPA